MRGVDLTPTDEVVALLLLAAHQRNMRRRHIKRKLAGKSCCTSHRDLHLPHPKHSPDVQQKQQWQQQRQQQPTQMKHSHSGYLEADGTQPDEQDGQQQCCNSSHELQQHSSSTSQQSNAVSQTPGFDSSESSCSTDPASPPVADEPCAACQSAACQRPGRGDEGQQQGAEQHKVCSKHSQDINDTAHSQVHQQAAPRQQETANIKHQHGHQHHSSRAGRRKQMHVPKGVDVEQGWGVGNDAEGSDVDYDADDGQVLVFSEESRGCGFPCVITPSSMAAELAPDLTHQEAAKLYLGVSAILSCLSCSSRESIEYM